MPQISLQIKNRAKINIGVRLNAKSEEEDDLDQSVLPPDMGMKIAA